MLCAPLCAHSFTTPNPIMWQRMSSYQKPFQCYSFMHNLLCSVWLSLLFEIDNDNDNINWTSSDLFGDSIVRFRTTAASPSKNAKNSKQNSRFFARVCLALSGYLTFYGCYQCWMKSRFFSFLLYFFLFVFVLFVCYCNCCCQCYAFVCSFVKSLEKMSKNFNECFFARFLIDLDRFRGIGMREQSFKSH